MEQTTKALFDMSYAEYIACFIQLIINDLLKIHIWMAQVYALTHPS